MPDPPSSWEPSTMLDMGELKIRFPVQGGDRQGDQHWQSLDKTTIIIIPIIDNK